MNFFSSLLSNNNIIPESSSSSSSSQVAGSTDSNIIQVIPEQHVAPPPKVTLRTQTASGTAYFTRGPSQAIKQHAELYTHSVGVKNSPSAVGLKFDSFEDVEQYFKEYSRENNFSMRRGGSRSEKGEKVMQLFECSSSRIKKIRKKHSKSGTSDTAVGDNATIYDATAKVDDIEHVDKQQRSSSLSACNCRWRARAWRKFNEDASAYYWHISSFMNEHNHELVGKKRKKELIADLMAAKAAAAAAAKTSEGGGVDAADNAIADGTLTSSTGAGTGGKNKRIKSSSSSSSSSSSATTENETSTSAVVASETNNVKRKGNRKKRYNALLGLCKDWCGLHAQNSDSFERAKTFITTDVTLSQQLLADSHAFSLIESQQQQQLQHNAHQEVVTTAEEKDAIVTAAASNNHDDTHGASANTAAATAEHVGVVVTENDSSSSSQQQQDHSQQEQQQYVEPLKGKKRRHDNNKDTAAAISTGNNDNDSSRDATAKAAQQVNVNADIATDTVVDTDMVIIPESSNDVANSSTATHTATTGGNGKRKHQQR